MRKQWGILIAVFLLFNCLGQNVRADSVLRESTEDDKSKIISVIFDDSTSMIQDDNGSREYTTRWVDADYAVKAMASMMDQEDTLRLYFMGEYAESGGKSSLGISTSNKSTAITEIERHMARLKYVDATYSSAMDAAKSDFTDRELRDKECWIVILTDGRFTKPEPLDEENLKEKLIGLTQVDSGNLYVAYVPIGSGAIQLSDDIEHHIIVSEEKSNVTKQVTEIINRIYGRVRMDDDVSREYLVAENDRIIVRTNVPMEKVVVFLQYCGNEEFYSQFQKRQKEGNAGAGVTILNTRKEISAPMYLGTVSSSSFGGKKDEPISQKDLSKVKYHEIQGIILTWTGSTDVSSDDFADQEIIIPVKPGLELQKEVYYQPAVRVGFEYVQNEMPVEHFDDCEFKGKSMGQEECCLQEGPLDVKLKMIDFQGVELQSPQSPFLYPDDFRVILWSEDGTYHTELQRGGEIYRYGGVIEEKKYIMSIQTPWNEVVTQNLDVQEMHKPLEIVPLNDQLVIDDATGKQSQIKIALREGGEALEDKNKRRVTITCESEDENVGCKVLGFGEDGTYSILVSLKDKSQHQLPETMVFHISAARSYDKGSDVTEDKDVEMKITSGPHTMVIGYEEVKEMKEINAFCCLWRPQELKIEYYCDGEKLSDQQRENVTVEITTEDTEIKGLVKIDKNKNLILRRSIRWWGISDQDFSVELHPEYVKYNRSIEDVICIISFSVHAMPLVWKIIITLLGAFVIIWGAACVIKLFTPFHIRNKRFEFVSPGASYQCSLYRKRNLLMPWWTTAWLVLKRGSAPGNIIPMSEIRMRIRNDEEGEGYILCNYKDFMDKERFRIGKRPIMEQNRTFSNTVQFSVRNGFGEFVSLYIDKNQ